MTNYAESNCADNYGTKESTMPVHEYSRVAEPVRTIGLSDDQYMVAILPGGDKIYVYANGTVEKHQVKTVVTLMIDTSDDYQLS